MSGIIDFDTTCPWELYLFAFIHLGGAMTMYFFDSCRLLTSTACTDAEQVMERFVSLAMLYVGVVVRYARVTIFYVTYLIMFVILPSLVIAAQYTVLTYHSKESPGKITRLASTALNCATALLASVVYAGNASFGGIERSWMHKGDLLTMMVLVAFLSHRLTKVHMCITCSDCQLPLVCYYIVWVIHTCLSHTCILCAF